MIAQVVPAHQACTVSVAAQFAAIWFQRVQFSFFSFLPLPCHSSPQVHMARSYCPLICTNVLSPITLSQVCDTIHCLWGQSKGRRGPSPNTLLHNFYLEQKQLNWDNYGKKLLQQSAVGSVRAASLRSYKAETAQKQQGLHHRYVEGGLTDTE